MSATADLNAAVCGGLAAALLDACGGEPDTAREWVAGAYAPSWGQVASALDDLRAAREHLTRMITEATACEGCGSPAGIGCAWDCLGTAETVSPEHWSGSAWSATAPHRSDCPCGTPYDLGSRDGRCGDCGECAAHCDHKAARCACVCECDYRLDGYAPEDTLCGACLDNCSQDMAVPCEICGARAGFLCPCVTS